MLIFSAWFHVSMPQRVLALSVSRDNPRYLADDHQNAIYLTGSHTWELIQFDDYKTADAQKRFDNFLAYLKSFQHNFTRLWTNMSYLQYDPKPWQQSEKDTFGTGTARYDLTQFNQQYFNTLKDRIQRVKNAGMFCAVMLFGSFNGIRKQWSQTVWHPHNNINPEIADAFSEKDYRSFCTSDPDALEIQRALVRKTIDTLNGFDNLIWEVINEQGGRDKQCVAWQKGMVNYIKRYENKKNRQHLVGVTGGYKMGEHMLSGNHDWISPDIFSMGYYEGGAAGYTDYVVISDTDHIRNPVNDGWGFSDPRYAEDMRKWVWKTFLRGNNPIFMDSYDDCPVENPKTGEIHGKVNPVFDGVRYAMGDTRRFANRFFDLSKMIPTESDSSTAYCLTYPAREYLIYQPKPDNFTLVLPAGVYQLQWYDAKKRIFSAWRLLTWNGGIKTFHYPFQNDGLLHLRVQAD